MATPQNMSKRQRNRRKLIARLKTLRLGKRTDVEVAQQEDVTREMVRRWRGILGLAKFKGARRTATGPTDEQKNLIQKAKKLSKTVKHFIDVCRKLKVSTGKLIAAEKATGIRLPRRTARVSRDDMIGALKLSRSAREVARRLSIRQVPHVYRYLDRYSLRDLAEKRWRS